MEARLTDGDKMLLDKQVSLMELRKIAIEKGFSDSEEYQKISNNTFSNIVAFNKSTEVFSPADNISYQKTIYSSNKGSGFFEKQYKIYKILIGAGNSPRFLFCDKFDKLDSGDQSVYLFPLSNDEVLNIIKDMRFSGHLTEFAIKHMKLKLKHDTQNITLDEIETEIIVKHQRNNNPIFFKKTLPIPLEELSHIEDFYKLAKDIISLGLKCDEDIDDVYISLIPEVNPERIAPSQYMKSANHCILLTNPGVKKTTNAMIITGEPPIVDCSSANLLGFATAENKIPGKLDGRIKAIIVDEIQEFKEEEVLGKLHTYMANGEYDISKGVGIKGKGHGTIVFQGNPKKKYDAYDNKLDSFIFLKKFRDFLTKISTNTEGLSRRICECDIGLNFKVVEGQGINEEKLERGKKIIRTIAEGFRCEFSDLLLNPEIDKWITKPYKDVHLKQIDNLIKECNDNLIADYLRGQKLNYRGVRGGAIRRAWLELGIHKVLTQGYLKKEDIDSIIESAEKFFSIRVARNLKSYANIIDLTSSDVYNQILEINLKELKPIYAKLMFYSLFNYKITNPSNKENVIFISAIENSYNQIKTNIEISSKYQFFSRVKEAFEKYLGHLSSYLTEYGIDYDKSNSSFIIEDYIKFNRILEVYKKCMVQ